MLRQILERNISYCEKNEECQCFKTKGWAGQWLKKRRGAHGIIY